jgi:hypothetical protein
VFIPVLTRYLKFVPEKNMQFKRFAFVIIIIGFLAVGSSWLAPAPQAQLAFTLDLRVSPASDQDPRNETSVAVNPLNDQIIVGASKVILGGASGVGTTRISFYSSSDGGLNWSTSLLGITDGIQTPQKTWPRSSDPSVASDTDGNFYLMALMLDNPPSSDTGVYVFKSTDGGRTFTDPVPVFVDIGNGATAKRADKCYITIDKSPLSPRKNSIYAIWVSTEPDRTVVYTSYRRPGDAGFSAPKVISHSGDMRGPSIATGPDGEVYAAWHGIGNPKTLLYNASTDGGDTWFAPNVAPGIDFNMHNYIGSLSGPNAAITIDGIERMNSFPVIDVDRSNGPNRGRIYVVWAESTNRSDSDIFIKRLTPPDGNQPTVSPATRVNTVAAGDQFFPWLSVDPNSGAVLVGYHDRREDPGGFLYHTFIARSTDGGFSFKDNQVSVQKSDPRIQSRVEALPNRIAVGIGDYIGLAAFRGKGHILWADTRNGKQEIFFGQIPFEQLGGGDTSPPNDSCQSARDLSGGAFFPVRENLDISQATSADDDPVSCSGSRDTHTVWYKFTALFDSVYGIETVTSSFDTVLSVYTGTCGALTRVACSDDFGPAIGASTRSLVTFSTRAGTTYFIEASGKGSAGNLSLRIGAPTITSVEFVKGPDGSKSLRITGAGFSENNSTVFIRKLDDIGTEIELTPVTPSGDRQGDGTVTRIFATKKKLKKLVKPGSPIIVTVRVPAGGFGTVLVESIAFGFTR